MRCVLVRCITVRKSTEAETAQSDALVALILDVDLDDEPSSSIQRRLLSAGQTQNARKAIKNTRVLNGQFRHSTDVNVAGRN